MHPVPAATRILARIIGPFLLVFGLTLIVRARLMQTSAGAVIGKPELELILGVFTLIVGLTMLAFHNTWGSLAEIVVSVFCWLTAIRGAALLLLPDAIRALALGALANPGVFVIVGIFFLALGAYFCFVGFSARAKPQ